MPLSDRPAVRRLQEAVERRTGLTMRPAREVEYLEEQAIELGATRRELDLLGWEVMDYFSGQPQEMRPEKRRRLAQKSRTVWMDDPNAGAAVALMNDFVFGRGVPRPKAADDEVQVILDEAWDDPDNQLTLTSYAAQVILGTDLQLQANVFMLMFDDGEDGKIKLATLDHDSVENAVPDENYRRRVLYYLAKEKKIEWDFSADRPKTNVGTGYTQAKPLYYEHWRNVQDLEEMGQEPPEVPEEKQGEGRVYHMAINRTGEMIFGVPEMRRTLRWFTAYNEFLKARVDMAQGAAAFLMKRKVSGNASQVARTAAKAISRESLLAGTTGVGDDYPQFPGRSGKILTENEQVSHESMKLDTGSAAAAQDAQTLRSVISAATRFPQHYLGDAGSANLATATAMELPVLKAVEARQEVFEQVFRWFIDRVIERAVEAGNLDTTIRGAVKRELGDQVGPEGNGYAGNGYGGNGYTTATEAHEDREEDEEDTERDLSYEFNMPNPLRRMMADLVGALATFARTFDPNNTNLELTKALAQIGFAEGFEVEDAAKLVERIWPPGYEDPAIAAARAQQQPQLPPEATGEEGAPQGEDNPYSAPMQASAPEDNPYGVTEALRGRDGEPLGEATFRRVLPASADADRRRVEADVERLWKEDVDDVAAAALDRAMLMQGGTNGRREGMSDGGAPGGD